ncbi:hypothetical protein B0O80DRAFT_499172 [Mortierella sp. GBAus27b]|nr:hypothetical protein B0O80DRAFT_499172 [Mortierella sp. GBAus27b]
MKKQKKPVSTSTQPKTSSSAAPTSSLGSISKKRKAQDSEESDAIPDHDLDFLSLLTPSPIKKSKSSSKGSSSTTPKPPVSTKPRSAAEVVVFDASKVDRKGLGASAGGAEFNFKKFMSSKISKLDEAPPPLEKALTTEEKAKELEDKKNDAELHSLIKASRLLEQYNADQLDGVERRRHQRDQLVSLGIQKKEKVKTPLQISFGMIGKQRERDVKALEEAKNNGTYHKSIKHTFAAAGGKRKDRPKSERGLKTSMGRFKNGMLTLSEKEIRSVQREGTKSGKKGGGGKKGSGKKGKGRH